MRVERERERAGEATHKKETPRKRERESVCNGPRREGHYRHKTYEVEERVESGMCERQSRTLAADRRRVRPGFIAARAEYEGPVVVRRSAQLGHLPAPRRKEGPTLHAS